VPFQQDGSGAVGGGTQTTKMSRGLVKYNTFNAGVFEIGVNEIAAAGGHRRPPSAGPARRLWPERAWAVQQMCRGAPPPTTSFVRDVLPVFARSTSDARA
jgi:hypothetical protein